MREAGNYYHIEQSAYWNRFVQGGCPIVTNRVSVTSGASETPAAKAYRTLPDDHELTELRSEAREHKEKAAQELAQAKLAREKLEGLTQGLAQTDQVIREARNRIAELESQNDELRRKAAVKEDRKSPDTDFSKIEGMSKQSKTEGLQPGPGSDD
jgi:chromosome segregation ATPase